MSHRQAKQSAERRKAMMAGGEDPFIERRQAERRQQKGGRYDYRSSKAMQSLRMGGEDNFSFLDREETRKDKGDLVLTSYGVERV